MTDSNFVINNFVTTSDLVSSDDNNKIVLGSDGKLLATPIAGVKTWSDLQEKPFNSIDNNTLQIDAEGKLSSRQLPVSWTWLYHSPVYGVIRPNSSAKLMSNVNNFSFIVVRLTGVSVNGDLDTFDTWTTLRPISNRFVMSWYQDSSWHYSMNIRFQDNMIYTEFGMFSSKFKDLYVSDVYGIS